MFRAKSTTANMLWKPCQRGMFTAHTTCEASDSVMLQTFQVLFVSVNTETRDAEFTTTVWIVIVLLESLV